MVVVMMMTIIMMVSHHSMLTGYSYVVYVNGWKWHCCDVAFSTKNLLGAVPLLAPPFSRPSLISSRLFIIWFGVLWCNHEFLIEHFSRFIATICTTKFLQTLKLEINNHMLRWPFFFCCVLVLFCMLYSCVYFVSNKLKMKINRLDERKVGN